MTVGSRLNGLRGKKSLADLGDKLGVSAQQLSRIENDLSTPSLELTLKICEYFNVTMDWLIRGIEVENVNVSQEPTPAESQKIIKLLEKLTAVQEELLEYRAKENNKDVAQIASLKNDEGTVPKP